MNINNPIVLCLENPKGVDKHIAYIQTKLKNLTWLDYAFGKAIAIYDKEERIPKVPTGDGEYFSVMPNDAQIAFSFFYPKNPLSPVEGEEPMQGTYLYTQNTDLIIWCNLKKIDVDNYALGEQLKDEVLVLLTSLRGTVVRGVISDDVKEVYSGWTTETVQRDVLMYPYYAMKFELELTFKLDCN